MHLVGAGLQPLEKAAHAVPDLPGPVALAFQHPVALLLGQRLPRLVGGNAALAREAHEIVLAFAIRLRLPRTDRAARQRLVLVGHDESEVDTDDATEAAAAFAGTERRVEREKARYRLLVVDVAIGTVQVGGETPGRLAAFRHVNRYSSLPHAQCRFDRLTQTRGVGSVEAQAILDHFQRHARARRRLLFAGLLFLGRCHRHFAFVPRMDARVALLLQ